MPLFLLPKQLLLWPEMSGAFVSSPSDWNDGRDARNERQWLESIRDYCLWRAGNWRRVSSRSQRESADRWWYLNGARTVTDILLTPPKETSLKPALPVLNPTRFIDERARDFDARNRSWLADELMRWNPALTDRVLLARLSHEKLVRMLLAAMDAAAAVAYAQECKSA